MSVDVSRLALETQAARFWDHADQRVQQPQGVDEAHTDTPMFVWGILGTPLVLPQPHYRLFIPSPYYVVGWGLVGDTAGDAVVRVEHSAFTGGAAVNFTDVTGGAAPTLAGQQAVVTRRLTTWTPNKWAVFDLLHVFIESTLGLQELTFQIFARRIARVGVASNITDSGGVQIVTSAGTPVSLANP